MLVGQNLTLRAIERSDLPRLHQFSNDLAIELAGGGDPPAPQSMARLQASIGQSGLLGSDQVGRTGELGIAIGEASYWGRG